MEMMGNVGDIFSIGFLIFLVGLFLLLLIWSFRLFFKPPIERKATLLLKGKQWKELKNLLTNYLDNKGKADFLILDALAQAYEGLGEFRDALATYSESLTKLSSHGNLYYSVLERMAELYLKIKQPADAIAHYLMIIADQPNDVPILYKISLVHFEQQNFKKAREYLERILRIKPGLIEARYLLGRVFYETANHTYSYKQFQLVQHHDSGHPDLFFYQARNLEMLRHYTESVENYLNYLKEETGDLKKRRQSMLGVVRLLIKLKDYVQGLVHVETFLAEPLDRSLQLDLMYLKANLLWHVGEEYRSLVEYRKIHNIKPDYKDTDHIMEKYKEFLACPELEYYLTSSEETFDFTCRSIVESRLGDLPLPFRKIYQSVDYYVFNRGNLYQVFFRHLEALEFSRLTDVEILLESQEARRFAVDLFSPSGVNTSALTHALVKRAHIIEGKDFINLLTKAIRQKKDAK